MQCQRCASKELHFRTTLDAFYCYNCGEVNDKNTIYHQGGCQLVRLGTNQLYEEEPPDRIIHEITSRLHLTSYCAAEVKKMLDNVTHSKFGLGGWFNILVGACSYIVMWSCTDLHLPISQVATAADCDCFEMETMISRVKQFLGLLLPKLDIIGTFQKMIRDFSGFKGLDVDTLETMVQQGNFIIQCTVKWFLTNGRRHVHVAVAVLVFIANLNGILVRIEDVAKEVFVSVINCKKRYNELLKAFVKVAPKLPWGKDVNAKNITKSALLVLMYIDMNSKESVGMKRKRIKNEDMVFGQFDTKELVGESLDHETLGRMYLKFTSIVKGKEKREQNEMTERHNWCNDSNLFICNEWWNSRSKLCKRLMGEELAEKDVGLDMLPSLYIRGCRKVERRREKIKAAKRRISLIACELNKALVCDAVMVVEDDNAELDWEDDVMVVEDDNAELDWEDFIIEALFLHQVKEEEIEKGNYKTLLDLHVFNSGGV